MVESDYYTFAINYSSHVRIESPCLLGICTMGKAIIPNQDGVNNGGYEFF